MSGHLTFAELARFKACLFDLDGVVTNTASVHAAAWKRTFDEFLESYGSRTGTVFAPFDVVSDYARYVDGETRFDGAQNFLKSRGISLPPGKPSDPPGDGTIWAVCNSKNRALLDELATRGVDVYAGSIELLKQLRERQMKTAVVSSSANTRQVLDAAAITDLFDVIVDGNTIMSLELKGKPAPDAFLEAARQLDLDAADCAVFEDALAGVAAGRAGNFGLVVGVNRLDHASALIKNGADVVVDDLGELLPAANANDSRRRAKGPRP